MKIRSVFGFCILLVVLYLGVRLISDEDNMKKIQEIVTEIKKLEIENIDDQTNSEVDEFDTELGRLFLEYEQLNSDTIGYMKIDDIELSYPIMYSSISNEYYLYKDHLENDKDYGSIYLDKFSNGAWDKINLIHGHNMADGSMFANLHMYNNQEYFEESSKLINVFDGEKNKTYEIFAVNVIDASVTTVPLRYDTEEDYVTWLNYSIDQSTVAGGVVHNENDLLVLSTCDYTKYNARILILASCLD